MSCVPWFAQTALSPFESPVNTDWMDEEPLLESGAPVPMEERGKLTSRLSMRRKLWKQNRKLKRGLTCDTILFKPPPDLVPTSLVYDNDSRLSHREQSCGPLQLWVTPVVGHSSCGSLHLWVTPVVGHSSCLVLLPKKKGLWRIIQHATKQPARRLSSGSITSDAESEGTEPDPPVVRRGRRSAIYETKSGFAVICQSWFAVICQSWYSGPLSVMDSWYVVICQS
ncbi:hypothetical protein Btru_025894 [Bulinus truncatus]|nr:hypothetical protein Btru_025894 [Bulinus truncatus]